MEIQEQTLRDTVAISIKTYFSQLDGQPARNVYEMVLSEIEDPCYGACSPTAVAIKAKQPFILA